MKQIRTEVVYRLSGAENAGDSEGVRVFDLDQGEFTDSTRLGYEIDTAEVTRLLVRGGANPLHVNRTVIAFFGPDSEWTRPTKSHMRGRSGSYINTQLYLTDPNGSRLFPVVFMEHDTDQSWLNHKLRHEIGHLVQPDRVPFYNRPNLIPRIKMGAMATVALAASMWPDLSTRLAQLNSQGANVLAKLPELASLAILSSLGALALTTLYAFSFKRGDAILRALDPQEIGANRFAQDNSDINPIKVLAK